MSKLIIVRHGETDSNRSRTFASSGEVPLNEKGRAQAKETALRIAKHFQPRRIVSSHFLRARQTAEIIAAELKVPAEVYEGIHERDLGDLKGAPYEKELEVAQQDPNFEENLKWEWRVPGGESFEDVRVRVMAALEALRQRYHDEELVVVSHGGVMLSVWAHLQGSWEGAHVPKNCGMLVIPHTREGISSPVILEDSFEDVFNRKSFSK